MASKKKNKGTSTRKSAKKVGRRTTKASVTKPKTRARAGSKQKAKTSKKLKSVSAEKEFKREFRGRTLAGKGRASAAQSEDLEGVSGAEQADSESVNELVEEGNLFEAGAVSGVQEADDADEKEVRTRELPEDDVPNEYLDKD